MSAPGRRATGTDDLTNQKYDTIIQGRASYDIALEMGATSPCAHMREYVASRSLKESPDPHVEIVADGLVGKVRELKAEDGDLGIYLCGGSQLAGALIDEVDELVIKTYPVVLGTGMPMFGSGIAVSEFTLGELRTFKNGVMVRTYSRKRRFRRGTAARLSGRPLPQYPGVMTSDEYVCPVCKQSVDTVVRRHKTLGVFVPLWGPGPCQNRACAAFEEDEAGEAEEAGTEPALTAEPGPPEAPQEPAERNS